MGHLTPPLYCANHVYFLKTEIIRGNLAAYSRRMEMNIQFRKTLGRVITISQYNYPTNYIQILLHTPTTRLPLIIIITLQTIIN